MLVYLASPYSDKDPKVRCDRYEAVMKVTADLISRGFHIFSPIAYIHSIVVHLMTTKSETRFTDFYLFEHGQNFDIDIIRRCEAFWILVIDGWELSVGIKVELALAKQLNLSISYVDIHGNIMSREEYDERRQC